MAANKNDLITLADLAALGVDVTGDAGDKAQAWITYVSNYLRLVAQNNNINLDEKLEDDKYNGRGVYTSTVKMVVANAVMRANAKPVEMPDATMYSQSASPYSEMVNYGSNATQEAYFKQKELALLGFKNLSGRRQINILRGVR